jgi:hypothetical protein
MQGIVISMWKEAKPLPRADIILTFSRHRS